MRLAVRILTLTSCMAAGPAACAKNNAPEWARPGVYVYRISTPDEAEVLDKIEAGLKITANLLDGSVRQLPIINGIIGHDHRGMCNWDGLWPYWNRVTYRGGDWSRLSAFMRQARDGSNAYPGFHVNLTNVNVGLRRLPRIAGVLQETRGDAIDLSAGVEPGHELARSRTTQRAANHSHQGRACRDLRTGQLQAFLGQRPCTADDRRILRQTSLCAAAIVSRRAHPERRQLRHRFSRWPSGRKRGDSGGGAQGHRQVFAQQGDRGGHRRKLDDARHRRHLRLAARPGIFR